MMWHMINRAQLAVCYVESINYFFFRFFFCFTDQCDLRLKYCKVLKSMHLVHTETVQLVTFRIVPTEKKGEDIISMIYYTVYR